MLVKSARRGSLERSYRDQDKHTLERASNICVKNSRMLRRRSLLASSMAVLCQACVNSDGQGTQEQLSKEATNQHPIFPEIGLKALLKCTDQIVYAVYTH